MKTYKNMRFEPVTEADVAELTAIMKRAFDADALLHIGKRGGPPGYDNGEFIRKWALHPDATSYKISDENGAIGMLILWIDGKTKENHLGTIVIDETFENQGLGKDVWDFVEREYPDTRVWRTETPIYSHRNHNFYVNKLGFHVVRIENPREWTSGEGQFQLEKRMK